jgi:pantothenate kinase
MTTDSPAPRSGHRSVRALVNGLEVEARVDQQLVEETLLPALTSAAARPRTHRRAFAFLVGPPGVGKSTLAAVLADAGRRHGGPAHMDAVGIDGFHHPQAYLDTHHLHTDAGPVPLSTIKGAPETFDVASLAQHLAASADRDVVWPAYDRRVHDVVPGTDPVSADLVLVEGNWLLLDEPGWRDLSRYAAYVVFIGADPRLLRDRLVERKVRGGLSPAEAEAFYERSDRRNVERVLASSDFSTVDLALTVQADGTIEQGTIQQGENR